MDIRKILKKHGIEENESLISDIEKAIDNSNMIPEPRFKEVVAQRNELKSAVAEKEADIENMKKKIEDYKGNLSEFKTYKQKYEAVLDRDKNEKLKEWQEKMKKLEVPETDKAYDKIQKVKSDFIIKDDYDINDLDQNLKTMRLLEKANFFESAAPKDPPNPEYGSREYGEGGGVVSRALKKKE